MLAPQPDTNPLEALAAEFVERHRRGEAPSVEEYAAEHPELAPQIRELFPTIAALERVRAGQERAEEGRLPSSAAKLERLGDLRIVREIGRGGMGIVYEAMQESLGRRVAVKVLARHARLDDTHRRRFFREARTAGRLHHTNIVPILGVGEQDGLDYFVMQYIEGVGLDSVIARMRLASADPVTVRLSSYWGKGNRDPKASSPTRTGPIRESALNERASIGEPATVVEFELSEAGEPPESVSNPKSGAQGGVVAGSESDSQIGATQPLRQVCRTYWQDVAFVGLQVAQALEYAHSQGTLHRDIKPGNLLLDTHGTTWVADFGLAKAMDQDAVSRTGEVLGTLLYMAPEQWRGTADARSDIYSLGVTLYELATLRVPLDVHDRMKSAGRPNPTSTVKLPRRICPSLPIDLETIVMKAMADEPAHRYQTAGELASDLARFLQDRPISVRRPSPWERWWRWRRRNPAAAYFSTAAAALLILVGVVTSVAYVQTRVALGQASKANEERGQALASEKVERERAESMLTTSLAALDHVFNRLVPEQLDRGRALAVSDQDQGNQTAAVSPESAALLEELLKVYDQLATGQGTQARLGGESARANRRIGDIHTRLGNLDRAAAAYRQSIEKYRAITNSDSDRKIQLEIARVHNDLGAIYDRQRDLAKAGPEYHSALSILEPQPSSSASAEVRFEAARTHFLLGRGANPQSEPDPGDAPRRGPGGRPPGGPEGGPPEDRWGGPPGEPGGPPPPEQGAPQEGPPHRWDGGRPRRPGHRPPPEDDRLGPPPDDGAGGPGHRPEGPHRKQVDPKELGTAIALLDSLITSDPKNSSYRYLLAQCYREKASPNEASSGNVDKAEALLTQLVKEHPDVADYHFALADTYAMSDIRQLGPEDFPKAEKNLRAALNESTALVDRNPFATDYAALHVHILHKLAGVLRHGLPERAGAPATVDEVGRLYQEAIRKQASLVERFPSNVGYLFWLAKIRTSLGEFWLERRNPEEARKVFDAAIHDVEPSYKGQISQGPLGDVLGELYERLAETLGHLGEEKAAQAIREKASKIGPQRPGPPGGEHFRPRGHRPGPPPDRDDGPDDFGPEMRPGGPPQDAPPGRHRGDDGP
ncbi:MAG TPA: protein kinase [Planctomycetaceae bacterium]|jgi:serine/threonine protein kinase|nr:protein kinase [Planctomycetaceae bacterium]